MNTRRDDRTIAPPSIFAVLSLIITSLPFLARAANPEPGPSAPSLLKSQQRFEPPRSSGGFFFGCRPTDDGGGPSWCAEHRSSKFSLAINAEGAQLGGSCSRGGNWSVRLGHRLSSGTAVDLQELEGTIAIEAGGLRTIWSDEPAGFGMRLSREASAGEETELTLRIESRLLPIVDEGGAGLTFRDLDGVPTARLRLSGARDLAGRDLATRLAVRCDAGQVFLEVFVEAPVLNGPIEVAGLWTTASWIGDAVQTDSGYGSALSVIGDVDGDGYSDFAVGIPLWDDGQADEGAVWVYRGGPSGPTFAPTWARESNQPGAFFATSIAPAGDVDGDGYADLIVGAPGWSSDVSQAGEGAIFVFRGGPGGLEASPSWTFESDQAGAALGSSVATAGDLDGDADDEVVVGAPLFDATLADEGRVWVFPGGPGGLSLPPSFVRDGGQAGGRFGSSVATAGDVDADGDSDFLVAAQGWSNGETDEGYVALFRGSTGVLSTAPAWEREGNLVGAKLGSSIAGVGDVDGDGYADVLLGASGYTDDPVGQAGEGWVFLYRGISAGLEAAASWSAQSNQASAAFGASVATAGDANGDGYADIAVGAPFWDVSATDEGAAFVWLGGAGGFGAAGTPINVDALLPGSMPAGRFGAAVATAGDATGDGLSDLLVGAPLDWIADIREGLAYLFRGSGDGLAASPAWVVESNRTDAYFGEYISAVGDLNGDGFGDVAVGAPHWDNGETNEGNVSIFFGSATGLSSTPAWTAESNQTSALFGDSVAAGDLNGDGFDDLVVGASSWEDNSAIYIDEGKVFVWYGSTAGLGAPGTPGNADWTARGSQSNAYFGWPVVTGDFNGDGFSDIGVGANGYKNGSTTEGGAFVYHGSPTGPGATAVWSARGGQLNARYGIGLASGDVNGDGYSDLSVGASKWDNGQTDEGKVSLYPGGPMGLAFSPTWTWEPNVAYAQFGLTMRSGGDLNGDGLSDLVVASSDSGANPLFNEGKAWAFLGSAASGLETTPVWSYSSGQAYAYFGRSLSAVSDFDGDGYSDLVVGAPEYDNGQTDEGRTYFFPGSASGPSPTPSRIAEPDQFSQWYGNAVADAVDVNGDGWDELLVGSITWSNSQTNEGRALLYYGNSGDGLERIPMQWRSDASAPLGLWDRSDSRSTFRLRSLGRSAAGRCRVRQEWEVKPPASRLDGTGLSRSPSSADTGSPVAGIGSATPLDDLVGGLTTGTPWHWRARTVSSSPYFPSSRWLSPQRNHRNETDLRAYAESDVSLTLADAPDPVLVGGSLVYDAVVTNSGPDADAGVEVRLTPSTWLNYVSAIPSQGSCSRLGTVVVCRLGTLAPGASATISHTFVPSTFGTMTTTATAATNSRDLDASDNSATSTTTVYRPTIGNRVWNDLDRDGIQDASEPGLAGVTVILYNATGAPTTVTQTGATGDYSFPNLTYGATYSVRFFPPPGYLITARDQGSDDAIDSDADPITNQSSPFALTSGLLVSDVDAGLALACEVPDEPVYLYAVQLDGNLNPELHWADPNQPSAVTGFNVYRSTVPSGSWALIASNVVDMYPASANIQWVDSSGDPGNWYYDVVAYSSLCSAEGPH